MKELFSKRAKKIITTVSLSCFLCSPVSYVCSMNQASAAALNTNVAYEQQFNTVGFDKDDHWNRGRSDEDKDWKKPPRHDDDDDEHEHHHDHEHEHHHDHDEEHEHHHDHEHEHEHHHDHDHDHHHHHADDVFTSWGTETPKKYEKAELDSILKKLSESEDYGKVLRSKGMLPCTDGTWMYFDLVPEEYEIREGSADFTGRICVIGSELKEDALKELFEV